MAPCFSARAGCLIRPTGDENDRDPACARRQPPLQLKSIIHPAHSHVQNQASCIARAIGFQEVFTGRKVEGLEAH